MSRLKLPFRSVLTLTASLLPMSWVILPAGAEPAVRPAFSLATPGGETVTQDSFKGRWMLVYFGYTHCADLCPTELAEMVDALRQMGSEAKRVTPVFVTIDPERDSGSVLKDYVGQFDDRLVGLGGTPAAVAAAAEGFGVAYTRIPGNNGAYAFKHASRILVIDPAGRYQVTFGHMSDAYMIASKMLELLSASQPQGAM